MGEELEEGIKKLAELKKKYNDDYARMIARARLETKEALRRKYQPMIDRLLVEGLELG